ncbi:MAG: hypothetical protein AB7G22_06380 [Flavobacteriales bacterium]
MQKTTTYPVYKFVITLMLFLFSTVSYGQWSLDVVGTVKKEETNKRFEGVTITIKKNGSVWKTLTSESSGKFQAALEPDGVYLIEFSRPGHVTKRIEFSTKNVPPDDAKYGFEFPMEMNLFEKMDGLDVSILNKPIAKVAFNPATGYMDYDPEYTKSIKNELDRLKDELAERLKNQEAERKAKQASYDKAIAAADKAFNAQKWQEAKPLYDEAAKIFPDESYPQFQLGIISDKLAAFEESNKRYNIAIAEGDKAFSEKKWDAATLAYQKAVSYKSDEKYPADKIKEIKDIVNNEKKNAEEYNSAIAAGDQFFGLKDYEKAKEQFVKASTIKSYETYPKTKITEIDKLLADARKKDEEYAATITEADNLFNAKEYEKSKVSYNKALAIKANEEYPKKRIAEAEKMLGDMKKLEEDYKAAIASADQLFATKEYQKAQTGYQQASAIKPIEKYPKDKLAEIKTLLDDLAKKEAEEKQKEAAYQAAISNGDKSMGLQKYDVAKQAYETASGIKPTEQYPKDKLKEITTILADLAKKEAENKAKNEQYQKLISDADGLMISKEYDKAKTKYQSASDLKTEEKYPKDKLKEIDLLLADLAKKEAENKAKEELYQKTIKEADALLTSKDYNNAKGKYQAALGIKADEKYPKDKIIEIETVLADLAKKEAEEKAKNQKYNDLIIEADAAFKAKNYDVAKTSYTSASAIKTEEKYPKDKLKEIESLLADLAKKKAEEEAAALAEKQKNEKYQAFIALADKGMENKNYDIAKTNYNQALTIKSTEQYPKDKLVEIENILAELAKKKAAEESALMAQKEKDEKYKALIAVADKSFMSKSYDDAKSNYNQASGVKPTEQYPKDKITEIEKILADLAAKKAAEEAMNAAEKEKNEKYNKIIAEADNEFKTTNYENAKIKYYEASAIKKDEQYPKDKINEITKLLADLAKKSEEEKLALEAEKKKREYYNAVIAQAEGELTAKKYEDAKRKFSEASTILPDETYPKTKIQEIDDLLAKLAAEKENALMAEKEREEKYKALIVQADNSLSAKDYENAKTTYKSALNVKPNEGYPKDKILEIDIILADLAKKNEEISLTNNALKQKQDRYNSLIKQADESFLKKTYKDALELYNEAINLMPTEAYPKEKVSEINALLANLSQQEKDKDALVKQEKEKRDQYTSLIYDADRAFKFDKFSDAKYKYEQALGLYPDEKYPKEQLAEIEIRMKKANETIVVNNNLNGPRVKITDAKDKELEAMMADMLKNREVDKGIAIENYKKEIESNEAVLVSSSYNKIKDAHDDLDGLEQEMKTKYDDANKFHKQNHQEIVAAKAEYESTEKTLISSAENKRQKAKADNKDMEESIRLYNASQDKQLEEKVQELYAFADQVVENDLMLQEKANDRRANNKKELANQVEQIKSDVELAEKRRKEREMKVAEYTQQLKDQEDVLITKSLDRRKYSRDSLDEMVTAMHKQQLRSSKFYELNVTKMEEYKEEIARLEKQRTEDANSKRENSLREVNEYEEEIKLSAKRQEQTYKDKTAYLQGYKNELANQEKDRVNAHADNRQSAKSKLEKVEKDRKAMNESKSQYHLRFYEKLEQERAKNDQTLADLNTLSYKKIRNVKPNDVYIGELKPSENLELSNKYPQGITEETTEEGNAVILKRIKVTGKHVDVYEKIFYKWGGKFYTKNGYNITETLWNLESIEK